MPLSDYPFKQYIDTVVSNDVWLGYDVTIMPGVTVGHGLIIGAKSVVSSDIPPCSIAVGNPAKVVKIRFDEEAVELLLSLSWWDWDIALIEKAMPILVSGDASSLRMFAKQNQLIEG
ncbi:CatB-related O-acetyltransferase [Vibrio astriarenae]|uniref:CatB-related O-acetyltransferase n=1 Tax=Vibrio astriarenae TaxID=1481923 RepID=UPI003736FEA4